VILWFNKIQNRQYGLVGKLDKSTRCLSGPVQSRRLRGAAEEQWSSIFFVSACDADDALRKNTINILNMRCLFRMKTGIFCCEQKTPPEKKFSGGVLMDLYK